MDDPKPEEQTETTNNNNPTENSATPKTPTRSPADDNTLSTESSEESASSETPSASATTVTTPNVPANKSSRKMLAIIVLVLALLLAGIGYYLMNKSSDSDKKTSNSKTSTVVKKDIPLLRFGTTQDMPSAFYPDEQTTLGSGSITLVRTVFEGLVANSDNGKIGPKLATSWTNPDSNTWVFKIRQGVKFHNGRAMTTEDVKASLVADTPIKTNYNLVDIIKSVDVVDKETVKVTTNNPDPLLLYRLIDDYIYDTTSKLVNSDSNGTGPFILKPNTKPSITHIELVPFEGYYGDRPYVRGIVGQNYETDELLSTAAKEDKLDIGYIFFNKQIQDIKAVNPAFSTVEPETVGVYAIRPLVFKSNSPIQKLKVRQAIVKALDRAAVIKAANRDGEPIAQVVPRSVGGYDASIIVPKTDVEGAKKLLGEAGYPNGLELTIFEAKSGEPAIKEVARQLKLIGITLKDTVVKGATFNDAISARAYDLAYYSNYTQLLDLSDVVNFELSNTGAPNNTYDNPQIDVLLKSADKEFNSDKRNKELQQVSKILSDDVGIIPIYSPSNKVLVRSSYSAPTDIVDGNFHAYLAKFYAK